MIKFRKFSSKKYSSPLYYNFDKDINKITKLLDRYRIDSYGVLSRIPNDYISISYSPDKLKLNIPSRLFDSESTVIQDIYETIPGARVDVSYDYGITKVTVNNRVMDKDITNLMRSLIRDLEYVILVPGSPSR